LAGDAGATFFALFKRRIMLAALDPNVVAFKSIVCYRTGLGVSLPEDVHDTTIDEAVRKVLELCKSHGGSIRLQDKVLNDWIVRETLDIAGRHDKPG
jgi:hypothetical protein